MKTWRLPCDGLERHALFACLVASLWLLCPSAHHLADHTTHHHAGDYYQALRVMEHIELDKKGLYSRVPACQVTVFYYVSFSYMMMGR